jgi:hypothetical protein
VVPQTCPRRFGGPHREQSHGQQPNHPSEYPFGGRPVDYNAAPSRGFIRRYHLAQQALPIGIFAQRTNVLPVGTRPIQPEQAAIGETPHRSGSGEPHGLLRISSRQGAMGSSKQVFQRGLQNFDIVKPGRRQRPRLRNGDLGWFGRPTTQDPPYQRHQARDRSEGHAESDRPT